MIVVGVDHRFCIGIAEVVSPHTLLFILLVGKIIGGSRRIYRNMFTPNMCGVECEQGRSLVIQHDGFGKASECF
nr:hypothetical transcript [Hymenolepis microstoma]